MRVSWPFNTIRGYDASLNLSFAALTAATLLALYFGVFQPIQAETARLELEAQGLEELIRGTSQISQTRNELEEQLAAKEAAAVKLLERIPASARESDFLEQVCELAGAHELEIADYQPGAVHQLENRHEMEVKLSARGEYAAICRFLRQADELPRLCRLVHMDITAPLEGERLVADLTYRISFAPLTPPAKQEDSP